MDKGIAFQVNLASTVKAQAMLQEVSLFKLTALVSFGGHVIATKTGAGTLVEFLGR